MLQFPAANTGGRPVLRPGAVPAILDYCCGGLPLFCDGGFAGGGVLGLGLVLGGGGGGFCSGAPPGCELGALGELAGGVACWSAGGVLGLDDSLDGELWSPGLDD
jgi:hypothetical protein